jgi:hypothetical protein
VAHIIPLGTTLPFHSVPFPLTLPPHHPCLGGRTLT